VRVGRLDKRVLRLAAGALIIMLTGMTSCSTSSGIDHVVSRGENLYRIGKAYGVPYEELAQKNDIDPPYTIRVGQRIYVRGAKRVLPVTVITPVSVAAPRRRTPANPAPKPRPQSSLRKTSARPKPTAPGKRVMVGPPPTLSMKSAASASGFVWPVSGQLSEPFGPRDDGHHDGIDIVAAEGTKVFAARAGRVIFSDRLSGYGNVVIIEHADGFTTVYAHNSANLARKGDSVGRGLEIASVGQTGRADTTHLHFEIRRHNVARDPTEYLPKF
jgi:murein DD-endopeptidase MepM/ murein hydrolase activator NlpD